MTMNAARMLVWVMSGMLIALLAVLVVGLSLGWHRDGPIAEAGNTMPGERAFGLVDLRQPSGTSVIDVSSVNDWISVTLSGGGVPDRVVLIDPTTGTIMGKIAVNAAGAVPTSP